MPEYHPRPAIRFVDTRRPIVVALGGNAFGNGKDELRGKDYWESFRPQVRAAAREIAELVARGEKVVVTFGNGPQVGHEYAVDTKRPLYEHVLTTQLEMGRLLEEEIRNALLEQFELERIQFLPGVVNTITHVEVDRVNDPAWKKATKLIGLFPQDRARELANGHEGWDAKPTRKGWRIVVPSPEPLRIGEIKRIRKLLARGDLVIACGGGGIPVDEDGTPLKAVIDKDLASSVLARELEAKVFAILTEAKGISLDFKGEEESVYEKEMSVKDIEIQFRQDSKEEKFPDGSIRPKMKGGRNFVATSIEPTDFAVIAQLGSLIDAVDGKVGTRIVKEYQAPQSRATYEFDSRRIASLEEAI